MPETVKDQEGQENPMQIVLASVGVTQYLNDGQYLHGEMAPELERVQEVRKKKKAFYQRQSLDSASKLISFPNLVTSS